MLYINVNAILIDDITPIQLYVRVRARAVYVVMESCSYRQYVTMGACAKGIQILISAHTKEIDSIAQEVGLLSVALLPSM
jgi:hypothetical protein